MRDIRALIHGREARGREKDQDVQIWGSLVLMLALGGSISFPPFFLFFFFFFSFSVLLPSLPCPGSPRHWPMQRHLSTTITSMRISRLPRLVILPTSRIMGVGWLNGLGMRGVLLCFAAPLRRVLALPAALDPGEQAVEHGRVRVWLGSLLIRAGSLGGATPLGDVPIHGCYAR